MFQFFQSTGGIPRNTEHVLLGSVENVTTYVTFDQKYGQERLLRVKILKKLSLMYLC